MEVAKNAPCPCGSGKKYKRCHGADGATPEVAAKASARAKIPAVIAGLGVAAGLVFCFTHDWSTGGLVALGGVVAGLMLYGFSDPPPPNPNSGDPAGLGFGR